MSSQDVKKLFERLAQSQGFYGRLLRGIEDTDNPDEVYAEIGEDCNDDLDVILKIEQ